MQPEILHNNPPKHFVAAIDCVQVLSTCTSKRRVQYETKEISSQLDFPSC